MNATRIIARAYCPYRMVHRNAPCHRNFGSNFRGVGSLVDAHPQVGGASEQSNIGVDVTGDQAPLKVGKNIRIKLGTLTNPGCALNPIMSHCIAIIRIGWKEIVIVPGVHQDGIHDLSEVVQATGALGFHPRVSLRRDQNQ